MRFTLFLAGALYVSALALALAASQQQPAPPSQQPGSGAASAAPSRRFDMEVRADLFAGFSGDEARFKKAMARCEEVLAQDPKHAEALVWHGSGVFFKSGVAFQAGDYKTGGELWAKGLEEMNRAVTLEPDNVGVRIPRGATLFEATRNVPDPKQVQALLKVALEDYEHTLKIQQAVFGKLSDHAKGELLFGLADGWARAGDREKAQQYFARLTGDAPTSGRAPYAKAWLGGNPPKEVGRCTGCH